MRSPVLTLLIPLALATATAVPTDPARAASPATAIPLDPARGADVAAVPAPHERALPSQSRAPTPAPPERKKNCAQREAPTAS